MVQSLTSLLLLLFATTLMTGHSIASAQNNPRPTNDVDHGRFTKLIDRNYEICPEVPTLHCKNDSSCTPGIASFGKKHDHLDLQTQESGYYCACQSGYIGHECEIPVDDCGDNVPSDPLKSCYNGSTCKTHNSEFICDCKAANEYSGSTDTKYAGTMCQHESTSMCAVSLVGNHAPNHQFCTNHGDCFKMVTSGEPHPGCVCKDGWSGDHCELRMDPFAMVPQLRESEGGGNSTASKVLFSLLIIAMVSVATGIAVMLVKATQDRNAADSSEAFFQGETPAEKTVVGEGDLDMDGSGTFADLGSRSNGSDDALGSPTKDRDGVSDNDDANGDTELTMEEEDYVPETQIV